ncbi:MAG: PilZ domain-containing protein [Myxococcota bacterium]|nr:PilZ domain-containing protein [Myxococcota bacterium]
MRTGTDRRAHDAPRVPLDLWVRLAHEDYEDTFDADGVDLSPGGLALRSDFLPEVGDRLRCRFDSPVGHDGDVLDVEGEVVWAHDAGERSGEFGLRFGGLDGDAESNLRDIVAQLGGAPSRPLARLHLDGVATPVEAEITEQDDTWMVAEQELPFLRIGMGVAVEGPGGPPRGRLASVDLRIEDGVPRLVLGVEREREESSTLDEADRATFDGRQELAPPAPAAVEATLQDFELPAALRGAVEEPAVEDEPAADEEIEDELEAREAPAARVERQPVQVFATAQEEAEDDAEPSIETAGEDAAWKERVAPALAAAKEKLATLSERAKPALIAFWATVVTFAKRLADKGGPKSKAALSSAKAGLAVVWTKATAKIRKPKRRTTAAPRRTTAAPRKRRRQGAQEEAAPAPRKSRRRVIALSVLAFAGVGTAVYALSGEEAPAPEVAAPAPAQAAPVEPAPVEPAPIEAAPTPVEAPPVEAAPAEPEGGRLGEPTYPTLADTTATPSGPVTEGSSFGSESVADGRSATLHMSNPVTTLRGQRLPDGFTVTIPGALSNDPAGPIAAANPSIERAMILNRGDHSVLTVRFVAGRNPDYRVVARGNTVEVTVGR